MTQWWVQDRTNHKRGPFTTFQVSLLMHLGSVSGSSLILSENLGAWKPLSTVGTLEAELVDIISQSESPLPRSERIPLSHVPPIETYPCHDNTCPDFPGCSVVYIWDRKGQMWLSFSEYVDVCREDGMLEGLPERAVVESSEQIQDLLRSTDAERLNGTTNKTRPADDDEEPFSDEEKEARRLKRKAYRERKRLKREAGLWVKSKDNPNIYISSLPKDVTKEELACLFRQAGQLKVDLKTGEPRVKLYGNGDGLITFAHSESVALAINLFNEYEFRPGCLISVQEADFEPKESETRISLEDLRAKAQLNRENRRKLLDFYRKERAMRSAWDLADYQAGTSKKMKKVVVFQNCFDPKSAEIDYTFLEEQMLKFCPRFGPIKKVASIKGSLDGFLCVRFETVEAAEACVATIDAAANTPEPILFQDRAVTAFLHDGRDLYSRVLHKAEVEEAKIEQSEQREMEWEEFLYEEGSSDDSAIQIRTE